MTTKARRAPAGAVYQFPHWCQGGKRRRGVPRNQAKVSISVQHDQDRQDGRTEVITAPTAASPPEAFAGKDYFCQDRLYYLSPFKSGRCGIPSSSYLGGGPRPLYIGLCHHHRGGRIIQTILSSTSSSSSRTPHLLRLFNHCTSSSTAPRGQSTTKQE